MNTEPPTGDDLTQMLVAMKHHVLTSAGPQDTPPRPARTGRRVGVVIGIIAVLGIGATSGAVALGMVPRPFTAAPAPTTTTTPEPTTTPTPSSAPVVSTPTTTPTPTPTRKPYALDDPSTWTISGTEVGPVAVGGPTEGETDDLEGIYTETPLTDVCPAAIGRAWQRTGDPDLVIWSLDGTVRGLTLWSQSTVTTGPIGPTTARGIGIGSTLDELRAAYPEAVEVALPSSGLDSPAAGPSSSWRLGTGSDSIDLTVAADGVHVSSIAIGGLRGVDCD